jgi:hypothetical protein
MVDSKTLNIEWINNVSAKNRKADNILVEKVIRSLFLLEGLAKIDLNFVFKGGTASINRNAEKQIEALQNNILEKLKKAIE